MAEVIPGRLRAFLHEHLSDKKVNEIMRIVHPLIVMTEHDHLPTGDPKLLDHDLANSIEHITGLHPNLFIGVPFDRVQMFLEMNCVPTSIFENLLHLIEAKLPHETREGLSFALTHSFLKDLCRMTTPLTAVGKMRRPSQDVFELIFVWIGLELLDDPDTSAIRETLIRLVKLPVNGIFPIGFSGHKKEPREFLFAGHASFHVLVSLSHG